MGRRGRSLFWTFAGTFLLVLAAASVVQFVVGSAVLRPLAERALRDRAALMTAAAAHAIAAAPSLERDDVIDVLSADRAAHGTTIVAFVAADGRMIPDRLLPRMLHQRVRTLLGLAPVGRPPEGLAPPERFGPEGGVGPLDRGPPPPGAGGPPGFDDAPRGNDRGPGRPPPDAGPLGLRGGGVEPPGGPRDDLPPPGARLAVLARSSVTRGGATAGEVAAIGPLVPSGAWPPSAPGGLLLIVPFAVLAAGAAGLVMVRLLVGRLRALDQLAARVAAGDLAARVEDASGDEIGTLGERLNHMIERLAAARAELERTDRQRRQLLADISHELATPLTSIRGYTETLLNPAIASSPAERDAFLRHVLDESERLDRLTRDLLELARLESGAMPLALERLDGSALCRNTVERFAPRFAAAGLALAWRGSTAEAWVQADGRRMEQVLDNLLANALRYVARGGTVEVALEPAGAHYRLTVSDDGPGIADADLPHVFERFWRAESARETHGSGLGLAIVKEIVQRHGGAVRAERRAPHGTRIVVEIPACAAA